MKTILILIILSSISGCSNSNYHFEQVEYRWYTDLEKALKRKEKVEALDLADQNLDKIPSQISEFENLKFLNLKNNNITELPEFLYRNTELRTLLLYGNKGINIDSRISGMTNLTVLEIMQCKMESIPLQICQLKELKLLALGGNNFEYEHIKACLPYCAVIDSVD